MTSQQYLLSQAEHCRRAADDSYDPFIADQLRRLAEAFEHEAQEGCAAKAPATALSRA